MRYGFIYHAAFLIIRLSLLDVGLINDAKGVGDILTAVAKLRHIQAINLKIAGSGEIEKFQHRAKELQISEFSGCANFWEDFLAAGRWHEWTANYDLEAGDDGVMTDLGSFEAKVFVWG